MILEERDQRAKAVVDPAQRLDGGRRERRVGVGRRYVIGSQAVDDNDEYVGALRRRGDHRLNETERLGMKPRIRRRATRRGLI